MINTAMKTEMCLCQKGWKWTEFGGETLFNLELGFNVHVF